MCILAKIVILFRIKAIFYQYYNIGIEIAEKSLKQGILTLTQQGDALCMVCCDMATHGSLFGLTCTI